MSERDLADLRGTEVGMIFQEPMVAFDPVYTVGRQITETIVRHDGVDRAEARRRALDLLERVRIPSPERRLRAYPHELSGGDAPARDDRARALVPTESCSSPTSRPPRSTRRSRSRFSSCCASFSASSAWPSSS